MITRMGYTGQDPHVCKCFICEKDFKVKKLKYFLFIEVIDQGLDICFECAKINDVKEITFKLLEHTKRLKDEVSDYEGAAWSLIQSLSEGHIEVSDQGIAD